MSKDSGETHGLETLAGRLVTTDIINNASPERVRSTFLDFEAWPEWSSFLERFDGPKPALELKSGDTVKVVLSGLGTIQPTIVTNTADQFSWLGTLGVRGIFDEQHEFHFVAGTNSTTHFVHREIFNGLLVTPILGWAGMHAGIQANFEKFNASLKAEVEGQQ